MVSAIDATKPADGSPATKSDLRTNLAAAKNEIEALQAIQAPVPTSTAIAQDPTDSTKLLGFDLSGLTTGTRRNIIMPDADVDLSNFSTSGSLRPVEEFGPTSNDPTVDVTSTFDASLAAVGYAYLSPGKCYGVSNLLVPGGASIIGDSKYLTGFRGLDPNTPVIRINGAFNAGNIMRGFSITGQGTNALECVQSPGTHISELHIGAYLGSPFQQVAGHFGDFDVGIFLEEMFSSTVEKITMFNCQISDACFFMSCSNHSSVISHVQTSQFCPTNVRIQNSSLFPGSLGFPSSGTVIQALAAQGGDIGFDITGLKNSLVSNLYTENTVLPIRLGNGLSYSTDTIFGVHLTGLALLGPAPSHPNYANRTCTIEVHSVEACSINNTRMGSYNSGKFPTIDGIHLIAPRGIKLAALSSGGAGIGEKHHMVKKRSNYFVLASFDMDSTDNAGRNVRIEEGGAKHWLRKINSSGVETIEEYVFKAAVSPPVGTGPFVHADATAYAVDDAVHVADPAPNGENVYRCVTAGTSGTGTPPTGTGTGITDGTVTWDFHGTVI